MTFAVTAQAQDFDAVRTQLDTIEKQIPELKKGDGKTANALIKDVNRAKDGLNKCDRTSPSYGELGARANDLDAWIRAQATGQPRPVTEDHLAKAKAALDDVEKDLATLAPGDTVTTNALVLRINAARTTLSKVVNRAQPGFKVEADRADALDKKAREKFAEGTKPAPGAPTGLGAKPLPADLGKGLPMDDKYIFTSEFEPAYKDAASLLNGSDPRAWAEESNAWKITSPLERMRKALARIKAPHDGVRQARTLVDELEALFKERQAAGVKKVGEEKAAAEAEAGEVGAQLADISAFFDPQTFSAALEPPFTPDRVKEWIERIQEYEKLQQKGLNLLDMVVKDHPNFAADPRIKSLRYWFTESMPKRLKKDIGLTTEFYQDGPTGYQGKMAFHVERVKVLLEPGVVTEAKLASDWATDKIAEAEAAVLAAEALAQFYRLYHGKVEPKYVKAAADAHALLDRLQTGAAKALANVRMPAAVSNDAALLAVARAGIPNAGGGPIERLVINYGPKNKSERQSDARVEGNYIRIWKWTETWVEFQVIAAERFDASPFGDSKIEGAKREAGAHYRLVSYLFKNLSAGPNWKRVNTWVCASRIVGSKIPKENIGK